MLRYLPFVLVLAVWIYAFIDCLNTPEKEVRKLPKLAWVVIILLFGQVLLGPIVWFAVGRPRKNAPYGATKPQERRWVAPDDNPDFLKSINEPKQQPEPQADTPQDAPRESARGKEPGSGPVEDAEAGTAGSTAGDGVPGKAKRRGRRGDKGESTGNDDSHLRSWEDDLRRREDELRRRERGSGSEDTPPG